MTFFSCENAEIYSSEQNPIVVRLKLADSKTAYIYSDATGNVTGRVDYS